MAEIREGLLGAAPHRNWIRLRTLVMLRWWAIIGQVSALIVAQWLYNLTLEVGLLYLVIGVTVITNIIATFVYPETKRLSETETFFLVLYDMLQLGLMLYLTGGLHNPFSILIVGPVTVSATALTTRATLFLGALTIMIVSVLMEYHLPLRTEQGFILRVPDVFLFGNWAAIVISVVFLGAYSRRIITEMHSMSDALQATQMALAREQKLTDLGGVVAAAAHELGTPLATIKLTSAELAHELADNEELHEDALLISEQADRCRDILRSMGRAGKDDLLVRKAPLTAVIEEAAEPHMDRGIQIHFNHGVQPGEQSGPPTILRQPEIIHGLRNLIQNAVDFADKMIWVETDWTENEITIRIMDDGPGYPPSLIGRIGDPFVRRRSADNEHRRPGYEGMGLGLFIAKTLLERSGAELSFANGFDTASGKEASADSFGAVVELKWPRARLEGQGTSTRMALGENRPFQ
ncbi:sensor histidine kinase RegB [Roseovarius faecimaris]|nr:ActS/PrrB/RegB family redox-sensitive histidine kinase [Roseovarius faecimaris]